MAEKVKIVIRPSVERVKVPNQSWIDKGSLSEIDYDFDSLWSLHPEEFGKVRVLRQIIDTPRWQQFYGKGYSSFLVNQEPLPIPSQLQPFLDWVNTLYPGIHFNQNAPGESYPITFNQILMEWYQDGSHYIGPHCHSESQLVDNCPIVILGLGAERTLRIRDKGTKSVILDLPMPNRSYLALGGEIQKFYTHEIPKVGGKKGESLGRRINMTFRSFKE